MGIVADTVGTAGIEGGARAGGGGGGPAIARGCGLGIGIAPGIGRTGAKGAGLAVG